MPCSCTNLTAFLASFRASTLARRPDLSEHSLQAIVNTLPFAHLHRLRPTGLGLFMKEPCIEQVGHIRLHWRMPLSPKVTLTLLWMQMRRHCQRGLHTRTPARTRTVHPQAIWEPNVQHKALAWTADASQNLQGIGACGLTLRKGDRQTPLLFDCPLVLLLLLEHFCFLICLLLL
jgi:hypothetical protein